ncbi:PAS domain S-box protein [Planctomycetota bacterium]
MQDEQKTKEELLKELKALRSHVAQFEHTESRERSQEATKSEQLFRIIFENAADGILLADVETKKFYMGNHVICQMLGIDKEEINDLGVMDIHPEKDVPYVVEQFDKQARGELTLAKDIPVKNKDGSVFYADVNAFSITLDEKAYLMGIFRNVSERKRAEEQWRSLVETAPGFIMTVSEDGTIQFLNRPTGGLTIEQAIGTTVYEHVEPRQCDIMRRSIEKVFKTGEPDSYEILGLGPDGPDSACYETHLGPVIRDGKVVAVTMISTDINERKKAENALAQSEEKFRLTMEVTNDALWDWNMVTNEVYRNPRHATMLGYEPNELTESQEEWEKRIHPDDKQSVFQILDEYLAGKRESFEIEYRLRAKSGDYVWVLGRGKTVAYNDDGSPVRMVGTNIDITDRKRMEEAVRMSEDKYRTFFEYDLTSDFISTPDGDLIDCNQAFLDLFGFTSVEQAQSVTLDSVYPTPIDREVMLDKIRKEGKILHYVHEARKITGETIFIDQNTVGEFDDDNNLILLRGHINDITDRKKNEEALHNSEERYRSVVEDSPVLMCNFLPDGEIVFVNNAYCNYFGKTCEELVGSNFKYLIPEGDRQAVLDNIMSLTIDSPTMTHEHKVYAPDDQVRWQRWTNRALFNEHGLAVSFQSFGEDITEYKQAEEEIKKFKTIADKAGHGVAIADLQGNLAYVNDSFAQMHQYSIDELIGKNLSIFHNEEQMGHVIQLNDQLKQKGNYVAEEVWHKKRDNTVFLTLMNATLVRDESGEPLFMGATAIDITKHKKAQEALQESELLYHTLFETLPVGVGLATFDGRIIDANSTMLRMMGFSLEEIKHSNVRDLYHNPDERTRLLKQLQQNGLVRDFEAELKRKDGSTYYTNLNVTAMKTRDETVLVTVAKDITEQRHMEKALTESEEKYRTLIECAGDPITTIDERGVILFANKVAAETLGYQPEGLIGRTLWDFFPKENADRLAADVLKVIETGQGINTVSLIEIQGQPRWYNNTIEPLKDNSGNITAAMVIARDVDDIKRAKEQIQKLSYAVDSSISGIAIGDSEGNLTYVNHALLKMWGYDDENEVLGRNAVEFWQTKDEGIKILETVINEGSWIGEMTAKRKDGSIFDVQICATLVTDENGKPISMMGSLVDISETKRREEELGRYRGQMARAEQLASLGTLSATMAHQLTQPLTVIRLSMDNTLDELQATSSSESVIRRLKESVTQVSNITSIIERFRNFARKSSGRTVAEVNMKVVAVRIASLLSESARSASIILRIKNMDDLPCPWINENDLEQLFFALIENAIQATDGKKARQLVLSGTVKDEHIELRISDNCGGIAPENIDKIFEPFFTTKPRGQGTGLGLCIVQDVVSRIGGRIRIESKFGKGTTFTISLPVDQGKIS